ncbi:MAG: ArsR family transcriptional regulator [Euryarchaeota archaeon]|nr:ArsR family transcriptional regulator [Euryarchaeota archaeon]
MPKIVLDAETFKVLASDTRLAILKKLDERPMTVSELGRELELNKATVFEHLQSLIVGELVKKKEREGRKWVYYTLTWKGKSLLHPENTTVMVLLGLAALGSGGAMLQLGQWLKWWGIGLLGSETEGESADGGGDDAGTLSKPADEPDSGSQSADTTGEPEAGQEAQRMEAEAPPEDDAATSADSDGGAWWDFLESSEFWVFALLFLLSTLLFTGAYLVKARARREGSEVGRMVEEAEVRPRS